MPSSRFCLCMFASYMCTFLVRESDYFYVSVCVCMYNCSHLLYAKRLQISMEANPRKYEGASAIVRLTPRCVPPSASAWNLSRIKATCRRFSQYLTNSRRDSIASYIHGDSPSPPSLFSVIFLFLLFSRPRKKQSRKANRKPHLPKLTIVSSSFSSTHSYFFVLSTIIFK